VRDKSRGVCSELADRLRGHNGSPVQWLSHPAPEQPRELVSCVVFFRQNGQQQLGDRIAPVTNAVAGAADEPPPVIGYWLYAHVVAQQRSQAVREAQPGLVSVALNYEFGGEYE